MERKKMKAHLPYIIAIAAITIIYMFYFFNYTLPARDISLDYLPIAETLKISYSEYGDLWPLWTPYGFSGSQLLMKPLLGLDSLLGILLLTIPSTVLALKLTYAILFFIAGISMYSLMIYLKVDKRFAFISSLIYMLNAHVAKILVPGWLTTLGGYAILPLFFLFGIKTLKEKKWVSNSIITGIDRNKRQPKRLQRRNKKHRHIKTIRDKRTFRHNLPPSSNNRSKVQR
jgi:hypothetical protein